LKKFDFARQNLDGRAKCLAQKNEKNTDSEVHKDAMHHTLNCFLGAETVSDRRRRISRAEIRPPWSLLSLLAVLSMDIWEMVSMAGYFRMAN